MTRPLDRISHTSSGVASARRIVSGLIDFLVLSELRSNSSLNRHVLISLIEARSGIRLSVPVFSRTLNDLISRNLIFFEVTLDDEQQVKKFFITARGSNYLLEFRSNLKKILGASFCESPLLKVS